MKITIYELLGMVKDKVDIDTYIRYYDKLNNKTDVMLACKENIIYNLDRTSIELNDEVEILEEEKKIPEKLIPTSLKGIDNLDEKIEIAHIDTISAIRTINEIIDYLENKGNE